jgi:hypothetical protein
MLSHYGPRGLAQPTSNFRKVIRDRLHLTLFNTFKYNNPSNETRAFKNHYHNMEMPRLRQLNNKWKRQGEMKNAHKIFVEEPHDTRQLEMHRRENEGNI